MGQSKLALCLHQLLYSVCMDPSIPVLIGHMYAETQDYK